MMMRRSHWLRRACLTVLAGTIFAAPFARRAHGYEPCYDTVISGPGIVSGTLMNPDGTVDPVDATDTVEQSGEQGMWMYWEDENWHMYSLTFFPNFLIG